MPCWFYDKKDLLNTPSVRDGISIETEAWYRKEGAKHIMEAGNKLGLRFDTCATGVVYFHRFYMFHSFKEFHRLVTSACCLFLAGKVEETPKKCKDIVKTFRSMLNDAQFGHFGEDPKEEVMTLERILLQTIKFDLMVEHPYAYLLKFAKLVKGDKAKIQKMVQMAWTFINDSLCTTLCLQWEPEIVAVAVMYLTSRLNKFDITDWQGKPTGFRGKWYEFLVEDVTLELLEDICHQVLDLYSNAPQPQKDITSSPAPVKVRKPPVSSDDDQSRTPRKPKSPIAVKRPAPVPVTSVAASGSGFPPPSDGDVMPPAAKDRDRVTTHTAHTEAPSSSLRMSVAPPSHPVAATLPAPVPAASATAPVPATVSSAFSLANPYMPSQMYSSSFMSTEGSQSIQSLMGTQPTTAAVRDDQGRSSSNYPAPGVSVAAYQQQQQYSGSHLTQPYSNTSSNQASSMAGSSTGAQRPEYIGSTAPASADGRYMAAPASGSFQTPGTPASTASYGLQQQQYASYQQPTRSQPNISEGYGGPAFLPGSSQSQYPSSAASAQSTSPVYQNYGGNRSAAPSGYGGSQGVGSSQQQQQRYTGYDQSLPANYQNHPNTGAGFQGQPASSASYQNQQERSSVGAYQAHSSGGYPSRAPPAAGYPAQQPSVTASGFNQPGQQGYHGREQQGGGSGYHGQQQAGYQQAPPGGARSGGSVSQQPSSTSNRGQSWGY